MKIPKRYISLIAALLIGGGIWHASLHRPTGPAQGIEIQGTEFITHALRANYSDNNSQPISTVELKNNRRSLRFRIGTFNIHGSVGLDGRYAVDRVADCLQRFDFVALNEVHGPGFFEKQDQAALLGRSLKMAWLFAPSVRQWYYRESGNALLTVIPVIAWRRIPLSRKVDYSYRNAVQVDLQQHSNFDSRIIHVLFTHLNRRYDSERQNQLGEIISIFLALSEPAILLGDLNSTAQDPQILQLMSSPRVRDAVGQVLGPLDQERIDWIFVRGLRCLDAGIIQNDASDHPIIWAELE